MNPTEAKPAPSKTHVAGSGTGVPTRSTEGAMRSIEGGSPIRAIALPQKAPPPTELHRREHGIAAPVCAGCRIGRPGRGRSDGFADGDHLPLGKRAKAHAVVVGIPVVVSAPRGIGEASGVERRSRFGERGEGGAREQRHRRVVIEKGDRSARADRLHDNHLKTAGSRLVHAVRIETFSCPKFISKAKAYAPLAPTVKVSV